MKKVSYLLLVIVLVVSPGIISVYAKQDDFPPAFLKGNRINVWLDSQIIDSTEKSFVIHGFATDEPWKDLSPAERKAWKNEATFELTINGTSTSLKKWTHKYKVYVSPLGTYENHMLILFYVQFDADQLPLGDATFEGTWTDPTGFTWTETSTVTIT
jgi:hypothetical protein